MPVGTFLYEKAAEKGTKKEEPVPPSNFRCSSRSRQLVTKRMESVGAQIFDSLSSRSDRASVLFVKDITRGELEADVAQIIEPLIRELEESEFNLDRALFQTLFQDFCLSLPRADRARLLFPPRAVPCDPNLTFKPAINARPRNHRSTASDSGLTASRRSIGIRELMCSVDIKDSSGT